MPPPSLWADLTKHLKKGKDILPIFLIELQLLQEMTSKVYQD